MKPPKANVGLMSVLLGALLVNLPSRAQSPPAFLTDGLVAYYPFKGDLKDAAGGNDISFIEIPPGLTTLASDTAYSAAPMFGTDRFGLPANALSLDATPISYARSKDIVSASLVDTFTMTIWAFSTSSQPFGWNQSVLLFPTHGSVNYGPGHAGVGLLMKNDQIGVAGHSDNYTPIYATAPIQSGVWHQVVVTSSAKVLRLYVDGVAVGTSDQTASGYTLHPSSGDPYAQSEFWIPEGGGLGGDVWFNNVSGYLGEYHSFTGSVSDFRIYSRALSDQEVQQLYAFESEPPSVPFQSFAINGAQIKYQDGRNQDSFRVDGQFTVIGGFNPLTDAFSVQVGSASLAVPAGSFTLKGRNAFSFDGHRFAVKLNAALPNQFLFSVAADGLDLSGTENPVPVTITAGVNAGTTTIRLKGVLNLTN